MPDNSLGLYFSDAKDFDEIRMHGVTPTSAPNTRRVEKIATRS